jgi:hypothetical protein
MPNDGSVSSPGRIPKWQIVVVPLLLSLAFTGTAYLAAGPSLGLFIGGVFGATLIGPSLVLWRESALERVIAGGSVVDGVGLVWLAAVFTSETTFAQWLAAYIVLAAFMLGICGIAIALRRGGFSDVAANAVTLLLALGWLMWPIWLSAWMTTSLAAWLVPAHPLLALNSLLPHLGVWGEGRVAYQLTNLGQDVAYVMPSSVLPTILVHALLGGTLLLISRRTVADAPVHQPDGTAG